MRKSSDAKRAARRRSHGYAIARSASDEAIRSRVRGSGLLVRQASWRDPTGGSPVRVSRSGRPVVSVAWSSATAVAKRTQRSCGVGY